MLGKEVEIREATTAAEFEQWAIALGREYVATSWLRHPIYKMKVRNLGNLVLHRAVAVGTAEKAARRVMAGAEERSG